MIGSVQWLYTDTDSDWAGSPDDKKSTSASVFNLGLGAISWSKKKQTTVAFPSMETEHIASLGVACEAEENP